MKKKLSYEVLVDCMHKNPQGLMEYREQVVVFRNDGRNHISRIITYVDIKKGKKPRLISLLTNDFDMPLESIVAIYRRRWQIESLFKQIKQNFPLRYFYGESANAIKIQIWVTLIANKKGKKPKLISLLTNDFDMPLETIVAIYRRRWQIESLFKQIKQNFPLRDFYGESANAIKIQIWVTLIANLLLSVLQSTLQRRWSFSGLATIVRIVLMYYLNLEKFLNQPDADLKNMLAEASESPPEVLENY